MLKRYEDALMRRMDELTRRGWTIIHWWEAYLWYDAERLGKTFWRDIRDRFQENNEGELYIYDLGEGLNDGILLVHSDGMTTISKKLGTASGD
jgi:hypothetical protein